MLKYITLLKTNLSKAYMRDTAIIVSGVVRNMVEASSTWKFNGDYFLVGDEYIFERRSLLPQKKLVDEISQVLRKTNIEFSSVLIPSMCSVALKNENYHNPQKNELIQKKREIIYRYIENVRSLLKEYENTENRELLKTAVQLQVEKLFPETENLRRLMSEHMEMTTDKEYINHYLFKNDVALSKNDFTFGEPQRVIHFRMK